MNSSFLEIANAYWLREFRDTSGLHCVRPENPTYEIFAQNQFDFLKFIHYNIVTGGHIFAGFYTERERKTGIVPSIFLDIDVAEREAPESIWENLQLAFLPIFFSNTEVYFSGSKGFHFRIYISPTQFELLRKEREKMYLVFSAWVQHYVDKSTFLSLKRLYRVPLTVHPKTQLWKIPVTKDLKWNEIKQIANSPYSYVTYLEEQFARPIKPIDVNIFTKNPVDLVTQTTL